MNDQNQSVASEAKKKKEPGLIPRLMNAFTIWSERRRKEITSENPIMNPAEINKRLEREWKELSRKEKGPFYDKAKYCKKRHMQFYSNNLHEKSKQAVKPKELIISSSMNLNLPSKEATIGKHYSDNHPDTVSTCYASQYRHKYSPPKAESFLRDTYASQIHLHTMGGHILSPDAGESTINFQRNQVIGSSLRDADASQIHFHSTGGYPLPSDTGKSTVDFQQNPVTVSSFTDAYASQIQFHATGGYPPSSEAGGSRINFQSNQVAASSRTDANASQIHSHATGGYPLLSDAGESTINNQLNPVAASSFTDSSNPELNQSYKYYPQRDDHNIFNKDMLNCTEKFRNCNPSESQQIQQQENLSFPIRPIPVRLNQSAPLDLSCKKLKSP